MKKLACLFAALCLFLSFAAVGMAAQTTFGKDDIAEGVDNLKISGEYFTLKDPQTYFGIKGVDLSGVKTIELIGQCALSGGQNGEVLRLKIDNPYAESIGFVSIDHLADEDDVFRGAIDSVSGVHDLYFFSSYSKSTSSIATDWKIKTIRLSLEPLIQEAPVPDSAIVDNFSDTWTAVDDFGRKVADFEEAGPVKEGDHYVGMFYWNWHTGYQTTSNIVIPDVIRAAPEARTDNANAAWIDHMSKMWWGEPVFGFYTSYDYWVYRRQAVLLANAGIDAIFMDYTNGTSTFLRPLTILMDAFADAKASGVNIPKISMFGTMAPSANNGFDQRLSIYYNMLTKDKYKDMWFRWEDKYFITGYPASMTADSVLNVKDADIVRLKTALDDVFSMRVNGRRDEDNKYNLPTLSWLENYPQYKRGVARSDGRVEMMTVGIAINESYVDKGSRTGVFSDPYAKDKGYSEAFGEDETVSGARKGWFFREQASLVLDTDPAFCFVDGWNEWNTPKYSQYQGHKVAFVDLFDEAGSRDFEPSRSYLKDDYYHMLVDFIRKYKGVRPAPVAGAATTIDIKGAFDQWSQVAPEFINDDGRYERDADGFLDKDTKEPLHYTYQVNNVILRAKAARDAEKLYFYAKTAEAIKDGSGWMNLYLNVDRNPATGWNGYDFAINKDGKGVVSAYTNGAWQKVGEASYRVEGNELQLSVDRTLLGETGTVDLELKWTDNVVTDDYLDFYCYGSVAPMGKFNYLYTEIAQTSLSSGERDALKDTAVLKAGAQKMVVNGAKMDVYEKDTRIAAFFEAGTLYVPSDAMEEILGYGVSKASYEWEDATFYLARHDLSDDQREITNYQWTYTTIGAYEARINGEYRPLSAPVIVRDNLIYVPLSYLSETFGWQVQSLGDGVYSVSKTSPNEAALQAAADYLG